MASQSLISDVQGRRWPALAALAVATTAAFARSVSSPLLDSWDDRRFLVEFEPVRHVSLASLRAIWTEEHFQAFHPMHLMSYWLDVPWVGPNGPVLHAVNLVLWIIALGLVLEVFERLGLPRWAALLGTLLYGLHPAQVEAVCWATGRKEILALGFSCGAVLLHLRSARALDRAAWGSRLLFVLAALSKTTVLPLPMLLFLIDVLLRGVSAKQALLRQVPTLLIAAGLGAVVVAIWRGAEMIRPDTAGEEATGSAGLVMATFTHHLGTALWPAATSPVYPIHRGGAFPAAAWLGPSALVLGSVAAWRLGARRALFAAAGFTVMLMPVSNVIPVYFQVQDRYLSLPLLPLAFGAGAAIAHGSAYASAHGRSALRWAPHALAIAAVVALGLRTSQYSLAWSSDARLWRHAVSAHPDAFYAWMKLGEIRRDRGDFAGAIRAYRRAIAVSPDLRLGHAALFHAVALRDERRRGIRPTGAMELARRYHAGLDRTDALRDLASELLGLGYRDATLLALGRSLDLAPVADERLERAAAIQLEQGNAWLARYYLTRMGRPPLPPRLRLLLSSPGTEAGASP